MKMVMESSSITATNSSSNQVPVSSNSTDSNNCQNSNVPLFNPQSLGREFVRQYYTVLNEGPHIMHRFYSEDSSFVHGGSNKQGESTVYGQENINEKILSLNFKDCHTKIRQVDSMETVGKGVVVQVIGELSNNGKPMRRFFQTFVLAPRSPSNYYVRNDIFRYQDEIFLDEEDSGDVQVIDEIDKKEEISIQSSIEDQDEITSSTPTTIAPSVVSALEKDNVFESSNVNGNISHNEISSTEKLSCSDTDATTTTSKSESSFPNTDEWNIPAIEENNDEQTSLKDENGVAAPSYASIISAQQNHLQNFKIDSNVSVSGTFTKPVNDSNASNINQFGNANKNFGSKQINKSSGYSRDSKPNRSRMHQGGQKQKGEIKDFTPQFDSDNFEGSDNFSATRKSQQPQQFADDHQVFVGNLPQEITEGQLQDFFSKYGNIVDVRINRTNQKSGRTPNYGFVTFDDPSIVKHILTLKPIFFNDHRFNVEEKRSQSTRSTVSTHGDRPGRDNSRGISLSGNVINSNQGSNVARAINLSGVQNMRQTGQRRERGERTSSFGTNESSRRNGSAGVGPPRSGSNYNRR